MAPDNWDAPPTPQSIAAFVKKNLKKAQMAPMHDGMVSVREDDYKGHHIVIRTTYNIQVDDRPVSGHINLSNDGQVAYHGLPNMAFDSAVDLVKGLIDHFPQDFEPGADTGGHGGHRGSRGGMPGMRGMAGMPRTGAKKAKPKATAKKRGGASARKSTRRGK
jgi:hypothetical protein